MIHSHVDFFAFPLIRRCPVPVLTTLHGLGPADNAQVRAIYRDYPDVPLVTISEVQRRLLAPLGWRATVHHGLPEGLLAFSPRAQGYAAFLGRISPEKRVDRAIRIAKRVGMPIKIAPNPLHAVAIGSGQCLEAFEELKGVLFASYFG